MSQLKEFEWTGERLTTSRDKNSEVVIHHLHRYGIAMDLAKDKVVLDIASGEGYGSNLIATVAKEVIGSDIDEKVIKFAQNKYKRSNLQFRVGSTNKMPVDDNSIDLVVSFETLEHHDKHHEMFNEIKRVLKHDGLLIMSSPDKLNYTDIPKFNNPYHVKELYREEFKELVHTYFSNVKIYYQSVVFGSLIVPEDGNGSNFKEFDGDFKSINSYKSLKNPVYNICLASNKDMNGSFLYNSSFFNAHESLLNILGKENEIYNSKTYKLGKLITLPLIFIRKIFK